MGEGGESLNPGGVIAVAVGREAAKPPVVERTIDFPSKYDDLEKLAEEHLTRVENTGKRPNLEARYAVRFSGNLADTKIDVQLRDKESEAKADVLTIGEGDDAREVNVVGRVWFTQKGKDGGEGHAVCYFLGEDGNMYGETATKYEYDEEQDIRYWDLDGIRPIDPSEEHVIVTNSLRAVELPTTPQTTSKEG